MGHNGVAVLMKIGWRWSPKSPHQWNIPILILYSKTFLLQIIIILRQINSCIFQIIILNTG